MIDGFPNYNTFDEEFLNSSSGSRVSRVHLLITLLRNFFCFY